MPNDYSDAVTAILILMLCVLIPILPASILYDLKRKKRIKQKQESRNGRV